MKDYLLEFKEYLYERSFQTEAQVFTPGLQRILANWGAIGC
jgi:hypothetical protein